MDWLLCFYITPGSFDKNQSDNVISVCSITNSKCRPGQNLRLGIFFTLISLKNNTACI